MSDSLNTSSSYYNGSYNDNIIMKATTDTSELKDVLYRRKVILLAQEAGIKLIPRIKVNVYTEFKEFSRKQIKDYQKTFNTYDTTKDGFLDLSELKYMMEKLGAPQTHLGLKKMIADVDEDLDGKLSFRELLLIYRKAHAGELDRDSGLNQLVRRTNIQVQPVGFNGAKNFFEAKIEQQLKKKSFYDEIKQEQEEQRRKEEERVQRRLAFQQRAAAFEEENQ